MQSILEAPLRSTDRAIPLVGMGTAGEVIAEALHQGLIKSREELFVTSKLWCGDAHHNRVLPALQKTLQALAVEYLDLYLIHWPVSLKPGKHDLLVKEDLLPMDFMSVWEAMEDCQKLGLTKSLGVSNFSCKKLEELLTSANIPPGCQSSGDEPTLAADETQGVL